jgi:hypothetical protein
MVHNGVPETVTIDQSGANLAALKAINVKRESPIRIRQRKYLNNIVEQDHWSAKKRTWLAKGNGSFRSAWRTLEGIETVNMIRKGRVKWVAKGDVRAQARFVATCSVSLPRNFFPIQHCSGLHFCSLKLRNETCAKCQICMIVIRPLL